MDKVMVTQAGFAPCPMCKQYSHSIGKDELAAAFNHFQSMYAHPLRGHPMGHWFDDKTRDAAQVLMAAARLSPAPPEMAEVCGVVSAMHTKWMQREELMRQDGGLDLMVQMADLLDGIVDAVPELQRKLWTTLSRPPAAEQVRMREALEAETAWLIERRVQPPQWAFTRDPTGSGAFDSDIHRAHRFPTRKDASEAMRRMSISPKERGQFFVSEHMWTGEPAFFGMDEQEFEDFLADAIDDSIDMDWTGRVGARAVIRALTPPPKGQADEA